MNKIMLDTLHPSDLDLPKISDFVVEVVPQESGIVNDIVSSYAMSSTIRTVNGTMCSSAGVPYTSKQRTGTGGMIVDHTYCLGGGYKLYYSNAPALVRFQDVGGCLKFSVEDLEYLKLLDVFETGSTKSYLYGTVHNDSKFAKNIRICSLRHGDVSGDIVAFATNEHIERLNAQNTMLFGDLLSLGNCKTLNQLRLHGTDVTGNPDDLAQSMYENGRISGTLSYFINDAGSKYTYTFTVNGWSKS